MASRDFLKHVVSTSETVGSTLGDEFYNPSSNQLFKRLAVNGTSVQWVEQQQSIAVQANSTTVATAPRTVNFAGAGVTTTASGSTVTVTVAGGGASTPLIISNKTGAYTVIASDAGTIINCTSGTFTVSLTAAATLGAGFNVSIWNTSTSTSDVITIDPAGSETVGGLSTLNIRRGEGTQIICDGTNWQTGNKKTMRHYAENFSATSIGQPQALGDSSVAMMRATASGGDSFALGVNASASATNAIAFGPSANASSNSSMALGQNSGFNGSQAVTGAGAMALGGSYASGVDSFAAAVGNNTSSYGAQGANSIVIGHLGRANGPQSCVIGGGIGASAGAVADGSSAAFASRSGAVSSGGVLIGGDSGSATADKAVVISGQSASASQKGKIAFGAAANFTGLRADLGHVQSGLIVLLCLTANATPVVLTSDFLTASSSNQVVLPNNSAFAFSGTIVARQQAAGGTASAAWRVEGLIRREANAASTTLISSAVNTISNVPAWTLAITANTTNGSLTFTATGASATNIRWVATIQTSEVIFA
jgi:hypothetical protein